MTRLGLTEKWLVSVGKQLIRKNVIQTQDMSGKQKRDWTGQQEEKLRGTVKRPRLHAQGTNDEVCQPSLLTATLNVCFCPSARCTLVSHRSAMSLSLSYLHTQQGGEQADAAMCICAHLATRFPSSSPASAWSLHQLALCLPTATPHLSAQQSQ